MKKILLCALALMAFATSANAACPASITPFIIGKDYNGNNTSLLPKSNCTQQVTIVGGTPQNILVPDGATCAIFNPATPNYYTTTAATGNVTTSTITDGTAWDANWDGYYFIAGSIPAQIRSDFPSGITAVMKISFYSGCVQRN